MSLQMAWVGHPHRSRCCHCRWGSWRRDNVSPRPVSALVRLFLDAIRAFPEIVLAVVVFVPIAGLGPVRGRAGHRHPLRGHPRQAHAEAIESHRHRTGGGHPVHRWQRPPGPALGGAAPGASRGHRLLAVPVRGQRTSRGRARRRRSRRHRLAAVPDHHVRPVRQGGHDRHRHRRGHPGRSTRSRVDSVSASSRGLAVAGPTPSRRSSTRRSSSSRVAATDSPQRVRDCGPRCPASHCRPSSDSSCATRETRESEELSRLAPAAVRVIESRGRARPEPPDHYRTASSGTATASSTPRRSGG